MSAAAPVRRADHVGGLIAPAALEAARARSAAGRAPPEELEEAENEAIAGAVRRQRDCGLPAITDGGFRWLRGDFLAGLSGVEKVAPKPATPGLEPPAERLLVTGRLGFPDDHPLLAGFRFLAEAAGQSAKALLPSPGSLRRSLDPDALQHAAYRDEEALLSDLGQVYAAAIAALHKAGCRRVQFDDDAFVALAGSADAGAFRDAEAYAGALRAALSARPGDLEAALYLGAGYAAAPVAAARLEPFADLVLAESGVDLVLVDLAVVPAPMLRFLPAGRHALLGLVDPETAALERLDDLRRAVDAAAEQIDADRLGIAPRRGFAPPSAPIGEDAQWRKLDLVVTAAERIWGGAAG